MSLNVILCFGARSCSIDRVQGGLAHCSVSQCYYVAIGRCSGPLSCGFCLAAKFIVSFA